MNEDSELKQIGERHRRRNRWVVSILVIIAIIGGGIVIMIEKHNEEQKQEHEYMVRVVKSNEAKAIFEKEMKDIDPNAFTDKGVIKEYSVDYKTLMHNPMGGIDVTLIINHSQDVTLSMNLDKYSSSEKLESGSVVESKKLVSIENQILKNRN